MNRIDYSAKALKEVERIQNLPKEDFTKATQEAQAAVNIALGDMEADEKLQEASIRDILTSVVFTEKLSMGLPITPLLTTALTMGYALGWMRAKQAQVLKE